MSYVGFLCILLAVLVICSCTAPATTPSPVAPASQPAPVPPSPTPPVQPPSLPTQAQTPTPPPVKYTLKQYGKNNSVSTREVYILPELYWTFESDSTVLIHFKSPTDPFTINRISIWGIIYGIDARNWQNREFTLKIWEQYGTKELWSKSYSYSDFTPTNARWCQYEVPKIKAGKAFSVEFSPNAEYATVGYGAQEKTIFKYGLHIGMDLKAEGAISDITSKGTILPWDSNWFNKVPRERIGWMIKIEGEGAPQK